MKKIITIFILILFFVFPISGQNFNGGNNDGHAVSEQQGVDVTLLTNYAHIKNVTASNADGAYGIGNDIYIQVEFDRDVYVANGTPQISLETGTTDRLAIYNSGSGSKTLTFIYTVSEGDSTPDLSYISTDIILSGAQIKDIFDNDAQLTLPTSGQAGSLSFNKDIEIDGIKPYVKINLASGQADTTNNTSIEYNVDFSERVSDFNNDDVELSGTANASSIAISTSDGIHYTITVSGMTDSGTVIINIPADVCTDAAGNLNEAATIVKNEVLYDNKKPTLEIALSSGQADTTNTSPISFNITFNEDVTGFDSNDITISGTANASSASVSGSGKNYTVSINDMSDSGTVIINIPADVCTDDAGNLNEAATIVKNEVLYDNKKPTLEIALSSGQADTTNTSPISFNITFSEDVTGFDSNDITVSGTANASSASISGSGKNYTVSISDMTNDGTVIINIPADVCTDDAGNLNEAATIVKNEVLYDNKKPTLEIAFSSGQADTTNTSPISFNITFSEDVTGFDSNDITVSGTANASSASISGSGKNYTVSISDMTNDGTVIINIPADVCTDDAGNLNEAATIVKNEVVYDTKKPTVEIALLCGQNDTTNSTPVNFIITFSEQVINFENSDIQLSGTSGATTIVLTGGPEVYNVEISGMTNEGTIIIDIPQNVCTDNAGNSNSVSSIIQNQVFYDISRPGVEILKETGQNSPSNSSTISFKAIFTEQINNLTPSVVKVSGTAGATTVTLRGGPLEYTLDVSGMSSDGTVIVNIPENEFTDNAGNMNTASVNTDNEVIYDKTPPEVNISSSESGQTDLTDIPFSVTFTEPVSSFTTSNINISNGSIASLNEVSPGIKWLGTINPINLGIISISVPESTTTDNAGNPNLASNTWSIEYIEVNHAPLVDNQNFSVKEDSPEGTLVGTIVASDPDNDNLTFTILAGNKDDAFTIDANNGDLTLASGNILNYELVPEYILTVEVTDDNNEPASTNAEITISIINVEENFEANNIITPDDARNKYWIIKNVENYKDYELTIRTSTGQVVYQTLGYNNDWDGRYNNKILPTGTYYFLLRNPDTNKRFSGFINIIRN